MLLSSLGACMHLGKAGAFSTMCSAVSRVPASELGELGKGLPAGDGEAGDETLYKSFLVNQI